MLQLKIQQHEYKPISRNTYLSIYTQKNYPFITLHSNKKLGPNIQIEISRKSEDIQYKDIFFFLDISAV